MLYWLKVRLALPYKVLGREILLQIEVELKFQVKFNWLGLTLYLAVAP